MSYYNEPPIYKQIALLLKENPTKTRTWAAGQVKRRSLWGRTNRPTPYCSGAQEIARRKSQIERGFIRVN